MPTAFKPMPDREGYFAYVGASVPKLPPNFSREEFDYFAKQAYSNLENAINSAVRIPIEEQTSLGAINLGYVTMKVEKDAA